MYKIRKSIIINTKKTFYNVLTIISFYNINKLLFSNFSPFLKKS